jgi:hypothetical protein
MIEVLGEKVDKGPIDIHGYIATSTLNMLMKTSYGDIINETKEEQTVIRKKIIKAVDK